MALSRHFGASRAFSGASKSVLQRLKLSSPEDIVEKDPSYSKWRQTPYSVGVQLSLGSIYAFSVFNAPLSTALGVVAPAAADWTISQILPVFGCAVSFFGVAAAGLGRIGFFERKGPRFCCLLGASFQLGGFLLGGLGVHLHSMPLLYFGYGVLGGLAMGIAYVPAVAVLLKWFPKQKGLASGIAVLGYGAGGLVAVPAATRLLDKFRSAPELFAAGNSEAITTFTKNGKLFASLPGSDSITEVVYASAADLSTNFPELVEGYYTVGTGSSGAAETLATMGVGYAILMGASALQFRLPMVKKPDPATTPSTEASSELDIEKEKSTTAVAVVPNVDSGVVWKTPQFWLLWTGVGLNCSASYVILSTGKTLMSETFGSALPEMVTAAFAATFVSMLSIGNLSGRVLFSSVSDRLGRKPTFTLLWGSAVPLYLSIPFAVHWVVDAPSLMPLAMFYSSCILIVSGFGATAATFPAYISDLFGSKNVAAIHGQLLSVLIPAGYLGPMTASFLRERAVNASISDLASRVSPEAFQKAFGAGIDNLDELVQAKVVTIQRLVEISPGTVVDPSPFIYDSTMMVMAGMHVVALGCNLFVRPVDKRFHEVETNVIEAEISPKIEPKEVSPKETTLSAEKEPAI
eukprot:CAMPEP_0167761180 /NCGR_PEP_ID=MMETSP0110_2-20121227/12022_1 /TAXON_ID=629695 /ORGANISM="Gymnochlora sp., Strain CCMP2014" /LENGTH=632 /DNA_ID=CAMNT_0007647821 /DNA_START=66 /DNA_END=1964 /DNA_ORIENTATION=+